MANRRYQGYECNGISFIKDSQGGSLMNPQYSGLYGAYERPSSTKAAIYRDWEKTAFSMPGYEAGSFGVYSRNCMQFSVVFRFRDPETNARIQAYITKGYNRCWEV